MAAITICAKFDLFSDNTILGTTFPHSSFVFSGKSIVPLFVNETNAERGLTILPIGIIVDLITTVDRVSFRVGIFDGEPINVIAKDVAGSIVSAKTISGTNVYIDSYIEGKQIKSIEFDTNGDEEVLVSICIDIII